MLLSAAAAIVLREPRFVLRPRFWAEEGSWYFANAFASAHGPEWYRGLTFTPHGYLALWPNLATTAAANLVPLESAPLVTTLLAFAVQLVPVCIVLWGQSRLWSSIPRKLVAVTIILLAPLSAEPWLNTINSQFYFALATFLLLVEDRDATRRRSWLRWMLLLVAGLTGPASCVLTPLFVFKAVKEKSPERSVQAAILATAAVTQVVLLLTSAESTLASRTATLPRFDVIWILWDQSVALTLFGLEAAKRSFDLLRQIEGQPLYVVVWIVIFVVEVLLFWCLSRNLEPDVRVSCVGAYALLVVFSLAGTLEERSQLVMPGWAHRYFLVPNTILLFMILANLEWRQRARSSLVLTVALAYALLMGAHAYRTVVLADPSWPDWRTEVQAWRGNPEYQPRIWPAPHWVVRLRPAQP